MIEEYSSRKEREKLSKTKYVISDWDGTLVDSIPAFTSAFSRLMQENFGIDPSTARAYYNSKTGSALTTQIQEAALNYAGQKVKDTKVLEQKFWNYQKDLPPPHVIPGAAEALKELKEKGIKIVVWSGTPTEILAVKLAQTGLGDCVDFFIGNVPGSSQLVKGPALFAQIASHFQLSFEDMRGQSVIVGDGKGDMEAGKDRRLNCLTIGIPKTTTAQILVNAGADFIIPSIRQLPSILGS